MRIGLGYIILFMYNVLKKALTFSVVATTMLWSVGVSALIPSVAQGATCPTLAAGDMIKVSGKAAIYAVNNNLEVLYFPSGDEFKSWRPTYGGYITVTQDCFDSLNVPTSYPGAVNYHPGSYVVKRLSSDQLYVVEPGNTLAKITAAAATALYGTGYKVMTVADTFWPHYVNRGTDISTAIAHPGMLVKVSGTTYYIDSDNKIREVTTEGFTANGFQERFVHTLTSAAIAGLATGTKIDSEVPAITDKTQGGGVTGGSTTTNLSVALASDNPASATVPAGATHVEMLKFKVSGTGTLTSVTVKRGGVGSTSDFDAVYIYNDDGVRLTSGRTFSSDSNSATFSNLKVTAPATLSVVVDIASDADSDSNNITLTKVNSDSVSVAGNYFTINGNVTASEVTVAENTASWETTLGTSQAEVAKFKITAGDNDVAVNSITLTNDGDLASTNLENLKLYVGSTLVASAESMDDNKAVMNFTVPYAISNGQTKNFTLYADITGGRTDDAIKFYVDEASDVDVTDTTYGVGAMVTNDFASGDQTVTMTGGEITLASNGPTATTYSVNSTGLNLFKVSMSSERNITVKKTKITITTSSVAFDPATLKNIKLVNLDSDTTLVGSFDLNDMTYASGVYSKTLSDSFDLAAGDTRHLAIVADFDTDMADGAVIKASLDFTTTNAIYDNDSSEYVSVDKIVPSSIDGNNITASASSVTVTKTATPADTTAVKGSESVDALGVNLAAGTSDSLKLDKFVAYIYADADTTFDSSGTGGEAANTIVSTVSLWNGTTQVGTTKSLTLVGSGSWSAGEYYKAEFNNLNFDIAKGDQEKLVVRLALRNTYSGTHYVVVDVDKSTLEIENSSGNLLTGLTGNLNKNTSLASVTNVIATDYGTLTIAVDGDTPDADVAVTGSSGVSFTKYKIKATNEPFEIVGAAIVANGSGSYDVDTTKVTLEYKDSNGDTVTKDGYLSSGKLTFSDGQLDIPVAVNQYSYVTIKADLNKDVDGAVTGNALKLGFEKASGQFTVAGTLASTFIVLGTNSSNKVYGTSLGTLDDSGINTQTVAKTKVTVANNMSDGTSSQQASNKVGVFAFTSAAEPSSNQKSLLKTATVQLSGSLIASSTGDGSVVVSLYNGSTFDTAHLMGTSTITGVDNGTSTAVSVSLSSNNEFDGTQNVYVVVNTNDTDFYGAAGSTKSLSAIVSNYTWNDGNDDSVASVSPVTGVPVYGGNLTYSL